MAKARMLHNRISVSQQVNGLTTPAALLFTWLISHADDDGRLRGEGKYIRATVVPMQNWTNNRVEKLLEEIKNAGLIYRWEQNGEWIIEFPKWKDYQQLRGDRYKSSRLPPFTAKTT